MMKCLRLTFAALLVSVVSSFSPVSTTASNRFATQSSSSSNSFKVSTSLNAFEVDAALAALDNFYHTSPYLAGLLTCSCKASAADWVAQSRQSETETNLNRNLAFVTYGGLYQGVVQTFIFSVLFPAMFPEHNLQNTLSQVAIDVLLLGPMVCMPTVYTMKAVFNGEEKSSGVEKYIDHVQNKGILFKYWMIWVPVQILNFSVVPPHLRVVFVAMVSFFWTCLLSTVSSSESEGALQQKQQMAQPIAIPVFSDAFEQQQQQKTLSDLYARSTSS